MDLYLCAPGFERVLADELGDEARPAGEGVVEHGAPPEALTLDAAPSAPEPVFAHHVSAGVQAVRGPSIAKLADAAAYALVPALDADEAPWSLRVVSALGHEDAALERRAALLEAGLMEALEARRRRVARRRAPDAPRRVEVVLTERERAYVGVHAAPPERGPSWPTRWPAGRVPVADDWDAPSSAFRKLREALAWLDRPIRSGDRCVDLGASPGGWTHVALAAGARVTAVDRAPLDARLTGDRRLTTAAADAFTFTPPSAVDWLLCDVIAAPERSLALLERWTRDRLCRGFVLHLKFKGDQQYAMAHEARQLAREHGYRATRAKKLLHDKNEVTLMCAPG